MADCKLMISAVSKWRFHLNNVKNARAGKNSNFTESIYNNHTLRLIISLKILGRTNPLCRDGLTKIKDGIQLT